MLLVAFENLLMMQSKRLFLFMLLCLSFLNISVQAIESIVFYLEDEPIYTSADEQSPGFLLELTIEMSRVMAIKPEIQFLPWKRAQRKTINTSNAVIFPLTRTASRENNYRWVCKIFEVPVMFINKQGGPVINSIEDAKKIRGIGVILGTPQEEYLKQQGVGYVAVSGADLYSGLAEGKYNFIYTAKPEAMLGWKKGGYLVSLQFGKPQQTLPLWIATNKESNLINDEQWIDALEKTKASGVFDALESKYFGRH